MRDGVHRQYLVGWDEEWNLSSTATKSPDRGTKQEEKKRLKAIRKEIALLQRKLYAESKQSLLVVFQAMDAAGKDSTIRAVFSGINPQGCRVTSFKRPTKKELFLF